MNRRVAIGLGAVVLIALPAVCVLLYTRPFCSQTPDGLDDGSGITAQRADVRHINTDRETTRTTGPMVRQDEVTQNFVHRLANNGDALTMAKFESRLREAKANGRTLWGSEEWMKSPQYYASLDTKKLAEECFDRPIFAGEMEIFDQPKFGLARLRIMHNGFAELFRRDEIWRVLLHAYSFLISRLTPENDAVVWISAAGQLEALSRALGTPEFKQVASGREGLFLRAHLDALRQFRTFLAKFSPQKHGIRTPFWCEAVATADAASMLCGRLEPPGCPQLALIIDGISERDQQNMEDMELFLDAAIQSLTAFVRTRASHKQVRK